MAPPRPAKKGGFRVRAESCSLGMSSIAFKPIRIGQPGDALAGLYAPAVEGKPTVLVVPPFPHEWQRSYRLFALLSQSLSAHGIGSLRFDPTGCGDSSGEDEAFCLSQLLADCRGALEWLRARRVDAVVLLGVRAGALPASALAAEEGLVWIGWQAVASGAEYLESLEAREAHELRNTRRYGARWPDAGIDPGCLLGHRTHPQLRAQLRSARLAASPQISVDGDLPSGLSAWVEEIDLATPFALPHVRTLAAVLASRLDAHP